MAHPDCELLDADLRLSVQSDGILEALDLADGGRLPSGPELEEAVLGTDLLLDFEALEALDGVLKEETLLPGFDCDAADDDGHAAKGEAEGPSRPRGKRDRSLSSTSSDRGRGVPTVAADVCDSWFGPPPAPAPVPRQERPPRRLSQKHRRVSCGDLAVLPAQVPSTSAPPADEPQDATSTVVNARARDRAQQNLVEAMQRSMMTRRHVMAQREMLTPEEQRMLYEAKERLNIGEALREENQREQRRRRSGMMASFFRNGTLTSGLEQSRRMIGAYMGRVDRGAL